MKALQAFIKPFEAPQRSAEIKISVNFYFNVNFFNVHDGKVWKPIKILKEMSRKLKDLFNCHIYTFFVDFSVKYIIQSRSKFDSLRSLAYRATAKYKPLLD